MPVARVQPDVCAGQAVQLVALPPALNTAPLHCVQVVSAPVPLTIEPALAWNAVETLAVPHAVVLVAFFFNCPALQYVLTFVAARVSKQLVTALQPVPVPCVQFVSAVGQLY